MANSKKSIVGDLIDFRGLVYSPVNESGVVFLFGKVIEDLNMYIEEIKTGFPDCVGRRFIGKGWERVGIEFEYKSSNFKAHGHNSDGCDMIVCWEHDWPDCPIEVIELREIIKSLPNKPVKRPDTISGSGPGSTEPEITVEDRLEKYPPKIKELFYLLDGEIKSISDDIWRKVGSTLLSYYSPQRTFIYVAFQKQALKLTVFTRGQQIDGVKNVDYEKAGAKWGRIYLRKSSDMQGIMAAINRSYELIREAIKKNENTGWYAKLEDEIENDATDVS